jgi:hypothetical protein
MSLVLSRRKISLEVFYLLGYNEVYTCLDIFDSENGGTFSSETPIDFQRP